MKSLILKNNLKKGKENLRGGMKNFFQSRKGDILTNLGQALIVASICLIGTGLAEPSVDTLSAFISKWVQKIGGLIAFIGACDFALGWKNDDPSERSRGIKTFVAGAMLFAVATAYKTFM